MIYINSKAKFRILYDNCADELRDDSTFETKTKMNLLFIHQYTVSSFFAIPAIDGQSFAENNNKNQENEEGCNKHCHHDTDSS